MIALGVLKYAVLPELFLIYQIQATLGILLITVTLAFEQTHSFAFSLPSSHLNANLSLLTDA